MPLQNYEPAAKRRRLEHPGHPLVHTLLGFQGPEDVVPWLGQLSGEDLRRIHRSAMCIHEAVRRVQSSRGMAYWLALHCHCNSKARWGETQCMGDKAKNNFKHKIAIEKVRCTYCDRDWKMETMCPQQARRMGAWHPLLDKHCPNPECECAKGRKPYKCAMCPNRIGGAVLLR